VLGQNALARGFASPPVHGAVKGRAVLLIAAVITVVSTITHSAFRDAAFVITLEVACWAGVFVCLKEKLIMIIIMTRMYRSG
jgi:hypothetical protein